MNKRFNRGMIFPPYLVSYQKAQYQDDFDQDYISREYREESLGISTRARFIEREIERNKVAQKRSEIGYLWTEEFLENRQTYPLPDIEPIEEDDFYSDI